ncbi:chemotaxis protein CheW [Rhodovulum sp. DZ06]|uniref:chemotaxis protein CheW n=1 Tax=Rhodovulum sp. DZ06 TaxID=3425126 RepID=UPI003D33FE1A
MSGFDLSLDAPGARRGNGGAAPAGPGPDDGSGEDGPRDDGIRDDGQFVTLGVDGDTYAVPVERVQEILDLRPVARLPRNASAMLGMIDVRGRSVPVADLRALLGLGCGMDDHDTRILVLSLSDGRVAGLKTDRVYEVAALDRGALERPRGDGPRMDAVAGIGRRDGAFVAVLDADRLLGREIATFGASGR